MTDRETNLIMVAVPIGEAQAERWRDIWYRYGEGAPGTFNGKLLALHSRGLVRRREVKTNSGSMWLYWREPNAAVMSTQAPSTVLGAG